MFKLLRITTVPVSLTVLLKSQLKFMSGYFEVIAISSGGDSLDELKREIDIGVRAVPMTRSITPIKDLWALVKLVKIMRIEKPLIVHTHTPKAGLLGMLSAKIAGVPVRLHTVAGLPLLERTGFQRKILNFVEILTYRCATKVYPNSKQMLEIIMENNFCPPHKIKVIGKGSSNGIDTGYFDPEVFDIECLNKHRENIGLKEDDFVFCFIGRVVADKGIHELVSAFLNIFKKNKKAKLIIVGPFEQNLDPIDPLIYKKIITHPGIQWIDFKKDIRPYLAISDVFTFPSYREGFPNVVMQAGAMGLPSIVSDINGCNEIIKNGFNGLIVPAKSTIKLQSAMEALLYNQQMLRSMKVNCRSAITSGYESSFVMNELLKEYNTQVQNYLSANEVYLSRKYV
jgi:glycosyltransferase involved in cell wall biosynthesis